MSYIKRLALITVNIIAIMVAQLVVVDLIIRRLDSAIFLHSGMPSLSSLNLLGLVAFSFILVGVSAVVLYTCKYPNFLMVTILALLILYAKDDILKLLTTGQPTNIFYNLIGSFLGLVLCFVIADAFVNIWHQSLHNKA